MKVFILTLGLIVALRTEAKIKVVTTIPDIAEVVMSIGGEFVEVDSLLRGSEDPHYADARPDYILKVNRADVVCFMGMDLEVGWLPKVLNRSGNSKVQEGGPGSCNLGNSVEALDIPTGKIDRSLGDIHVHGNPHFNLSPAKLAESGDEILRTLSNIAPENRATFEKNYTTFKLRMTQLQSSLSKSVKKGKVMEYHKEFTYFFNAYDLESIGSLEEKPGMPPSAARIGTIAKQAKENGVRILFATPSAPHKVLERFKELSGIPVVIVPSYIQTSGKNRTKSIEELQTFLVKSLP